MAIALYNTSTHQRVTIMDKMLYVAMTGAKENFNAIAIRGNNLANASTTGFKADLEQARSMNAYGEGFQTRVFAMTERPGYNLDSGSIMTTDRDLDVAIKGDGYIAVQDADGNEAYTRNGSFEIDVNGILRTSNGLAVLDEVGQEIILPIPLEKVNINKDGVVSGRPEGADANIVEEFAQIKLVKLASSVTVKGTDGLFRAANGNIAEPDLDVELMSGSLESSNVNVVEEMTGLIRLQRQFDMQLKMMETAKDIDESQTSLLRLS
jgi:flagellar basal-body rod protein FlgF